MKQENRLVNLKIERVDLKFARHSYANDSAGKCYWKDPELITPNYAVFEALHRPQFKYCYEEQPVYGCASRNAGVETSQLLIRV